MSDEQIQEAKLRALIFVQVIGIFAAWTLYFCLRAYETLPENGHLLTKVLSVASALTVLIAAFSRPGFEGLRSLWQSIKSLNQPRKFKPLPNTRWLFVGLTGALRSFAFINTLGIGFCIAQTGGSERSVFVPFLLTIPAIIILVETCVWGEVAFWGLLAVGVFYAATEPFKGFQITDEIFHRRCLAIATAVSTLFPLLYYNVRSAKHLCPTCHGTGRVFDQEST